MYVTLCSIFGYAYQGESSVNGYESIKIYKIYFRFFVWCHPYIDDKFRVVLPLKYISGRVFYAVV